MALISAAELRQLLDSDTDVRLCDVRLDLVDHDLARRGYDAGHIAGAVFVDLHSELAGGPGGGRHPLPTPQAFTEFLGRLGITPDTTVVVYDDVASSVASRLWWMLRSIGHEHCVVLDGGLAAWLAIGGAVETTDVTVEPTTYPSASSWPGAVTADEVSAAVEAGDTVIDARGASRYRGEFEPIDSRAGHIPGAINLDHAATVGEDGRHLDVDRLSEMFAGLPTSPIVYCGSGVTACHLALALAEVGIDDVRLYPGSWSEWSSSGRPAEKVEAPPT